MYRMAKLFCAASALLIMLAPIAALGHGGERERGWWSSWFGDRCDDRSPARSVPEFDPAAAGAIGAVLGGGAVLIARRRKARP
jgi:hypothetical protein